MAKKRSLAGSRAIITGGSSGIGKAMAVNLAAAGASVTIAARRESLLAEAAGEIRSKAANPPGGPAASAPSVDTAVLDVADREAVEAFAARYSREMGAPDLLINCAGMTYPGYFEDIPYEIFEETMAVDFFGVLHMCRAFVPLMKARGGHILNVSSAAGLYGVFGYTAYSAAKFAVVGFSQVLRSELKPYDLRVSVLCPTDTDTPQLAFEESLKPKETKVMAATTGLMSAEVVAGVAVRSLFSNRFLIVPGTEGRLSYLAARFAPGLLERYLDRRVRRGMAT